RQNAGPERGALAAVAFMANTVHAWIQAIRLLNSLPRPVPAPVVHKNQFTGVRLFVECLRHLARQRQDIVFFIEDGDDDGDLDGHGGSVTADRRKLKVESNGLRSAGSFQ